MQAFLGLSRVPTHVVMLVTRPSIRGVERVTSLRTSAWEAKTFARNVRCLAKMQITKSSSFQHFPQT